MKYLISFIFLCLTSFLFAQNGKQQISNPEVIELTYHGLTPKVSDILEDKYFPPTRAEKLGYVPKKDWILHEKVNPNALPLGEDPVWQKNYAPASTRRNTLNSWDGRGYTNVNPGDPSIDASANHVIQMVNNNSSVYVTIYDKVGNQESQFLLSSLTNETGAGDPIVIYDQLADRWLLSEFAPSGTNELIIAISQTNDPLGAYHFYTFPTPNFPDYPKYSIWNDGYYVTSNESGDGAVYALDRSNMLNGNTATSQRFTIPDFNTIGFQASAPVSLSGSALPPTDNPAYFMRMGDDGWSGVTDDHLEIWELDIDFANSANSTLTKLPDILTQPFDTELCGYTAFSCIEQPGGSSPELDPLREVLMNRVYYRNFGTHESIVCNHVTDVDGNDRAGIRWYELRRSNGGSWSIYQQGTYSPDSDSRWMAGIGINQFGDIGLAYNVSSSSTSPSIRYTGRYHDDPLGTMSYGETTIVAGSASNGSNRWGDYNCLVLDGGNQTSFWFTGQYNTSSSWSTRVAEFELPPRDPIVSFATTAETVTEETSIVDGCLGYQLIGVSVGLSNAPSAPVDVTVQVSGTADEGLRQDVFVSPKTFTLDANQLSTVCTLQVYDDLSTEATENLMLNLSIDANGGDAILSASNNSFTLTILDNDEVSSSNLYVYSENFDSAPTDWIINSGGTGTETWYFEDAYGSNSASFNGSQFLFIDSDADGAGDTQADTVTSPTIALVPNQAADIEWIQNFRPYNDNTDRIIAQVFDGTSWATIQDQAGDDGSLGTFNEPDTFRLDITAYANPNFKVRFIYIGEYDWYWAIDDFKVTQDQVIVVATELNTGQSNFNFGPNNDIFVRSNDSLIARLTNTTNHDFGCVNLTIDRAGTGSSPLSGQSSGSTDFMDKTILLTFLDGDQSGHPFDLTMYFTPDEVAGYESATGLDWSVDDVNLFRYDQSISTSSASDMAEAGLNSVRGQWALTDSSFTATFGGSDGGFGLRKNDCSTYLDIDQVNNTSVFQARDSIDSDALIANTKDVTFLAGQNVELQPNFEVQTGGLFLADIANCGVSPIAAMVPIHTIRNKTSRVHPPVNFVKRKVSYPNDYVGISANKNKLLIDGLMTKNHMNTDVVIDVYKNGQKVTSKQMKLDRNKGKYYSVLLPSRYLKKGKRVKINTDGYSYWIK